MTETQEVIRQIGSLSYLGIFGISIISNVIIPVPEEVVLLALGYLAGGPSLNIFILLPIVFAGLLVSDMAMYFLSSHKNKLVNIFYKKFFEAHLEKKKEWLERHINKVIFFSRFMVQLRFLGPFLAGQRGVPWKKFLLLDSCALLIYVPLYIWVGWYFRSRIDFIADGVATIKNAIIILVLFALIIAFSRFIRKLILGNKSKEPEVAENEKGEPAV